MINNGNMFPMQSDNLMREEEKVASVSNDILSEDGGGPRKNFFEEVLDIGANADDEPLDNFLIMNRGPSSYFNN
jgi:hypothetical protein